MAEPTLQSLGRYTIRAEIGRGGFATVYRALDTSLEREVALKILHPQLLTDRAFAERFRKEARALAALRHSNIVTVFEVSEADGRLYIAMELAKGPSLAQAIAERGRIPWSETVALLKPVCEALNYAHAQGIIHRDLKPANILLDQDRGALLTDFGFARLMGESSVSMSLSGGVMGTPAYIAPEVWELEAARPAADIYALGCIVFEMLTGQALFAGKTPMQAMRAHDKGPQFPAAWPEGVPAGVEAILRQALARQPEARFPSANALWQALNDIEVDTQAQREKAERAAVAAQWKTEAEAALAAREWSAARMAVGRWLAITPDDTAALAMRQEIDRRESEAHTKAEAERKAREEQARRKQADLDQIEAAARARREAEQREREEQEQRQQDAERLKQYRAAQAAAKQKKHEEQTRRMQAGLDQIEAAAQARREAEQRAREEKEQQQRDAERLKQYRAAQAAEQKAREERERQAAYRAKEERRRRETASHPTQTTLRATAQPIGCVFGIWWTVATAIAALVGIFAGVLAGVALNSWRNPTPIPLWAVFGLCTGIAQYIVLRHRIAGAAWWILASSLDWALGLIIGETVVPVTNSYSGYWREWSFISLSLSVGVAQWLVLRKSASQASQWIPINLAGWFVAWGVAMWVVWPTVKYDDTLGILLPLITAAIVGGGITGLTLMRMLTANKNLTGS